MIMLPTLGTCQVAAHTEASTMQDRPWTETWHDLVLTLHADTCMATGASISKLFDIEYQTIFNTVFHYLILNNTMHHFSFNNSLYA